MAEEAFAGTEGQFVGKINYAPLPDVVVRIASKEQKRDCISHGKPLLANNRHPGQGRTGVRLCPGRLFYLTVMVTAVEWLSEPDVPVTIKVA